MNHETRERGPVMMRKSTLKIFGKYTAMDLHLAIRVVLARAHLRALRSEPPIGCDVKSTGTLIRL